MKFGLIMSAATALSAAAMVSAEPSPPKARDTAQTLDQLPIVMASADRLPNAEAKSADTLAPATPPKRPRAARVTSCRCGDPGQ